MKRVWAVALVGVAACAKGSAPDINGNTDAPPVEVDAPPGPGIDAEETFVDAAPDARPDAPPPDATIIAPDAPPDACVPIATEKLVNPVLDLSPQGMGWVDGRDARVNALPGGPFPMISPNPTGLASHSAPHKAWFGGAAGGDVSPPTASLTDQLHQDITFPADATTFVVSGFFIVGTNESGSTVFDTFSIDVTETNGTPIENVLAINNTTVTSDTVYSSFSKTLVSNLAGRTVRLRLVSLNDDILHTNFFLDTLSFKGTFCP